MTAEGVLFTTDETGTLGFDPHGPYAHLPARAKGTPQGPSQSTKSLPLPGYIQGLTNLGVVGGRRV